MKNAVNVDLHGKTAFITGGGSGIGRGLALQMAQDGCAVVVTDLDGNAAATVANEISANGGAAIPLTLDVSVHADVVACMEQAMETYEHVDIVIANAGILGPGPFNEIKATDWDRVLDINVKGVTYTCEAVASHMMERRQGRILITASYNGVRTGAHVIPYRVSKAAVIMYTRCLALQMAPYGVTVNAICPGVTLTPLQMSYAAKTAANQGVSTEAYLDDRASRIPMQQFTAIEDLTHLAQFLVSDGARLITGQAIGPDGGMLALS